MLIYEYVIVHERVCVYELFGLTMSLLDYPCICTYVSRVLRSGPGCPVTVTITEKKDGSGVDVRYCGTHTHDCTNSLLVTDQVNPLEYCDEIRSLVHASLTANMKGNKILTAVQQEYTTLDSGRPSEFTLARLFDFANSVQRKHIQQEHRSIKGLTRYHPKDAESVLCMTTSEEWMESIRYYKGRGAENEDTRNEELKEFGKGTCQLPLKIVSLPVVIKISTPSQTCTPPCPTSYFFDR